MNSSFVKAIACCVTLAALLSISSAVAAERGALRVGAARVDFTPPDNPEWSAGKYKHQLPYTLQGEHPPSGKYDHERVYARAIVLDNGVTRAALIGVDSIILWDDIWTRASKQIASDLNCPVENIIMSASHSHSVNYEPVPEPPEIKEPSSAPAMLAAIVEAAHQAKAKLQPARVGYGVGLSYFNANRDLPLNEPDHLWSEQANLNGPSDKTLAVLTFTTPAGDPIAAYMNYGMHPTYIYLSGVISGDFPGAACRYVEKQFDDKMVMVFSQAAQGDQMPVWLRPASNVMASRSGVKITGYEMGREVLEHPLREGLVPFGPVDPQVLDNVEHWVESLGQLLGEDVIRVMTQTHNKAMSGDVTIWAAQKMLTCPGRKRTGEAQLGPAYHSVEGKPETFQDSKPVYVRLGVLGIGDIALTSVDAEIYAMIAQRVKTNSPMANTVVVTLANGFTLGGYIPDDASFSHYTFEVLSSHFKPGCAEQGIADGLDSLVTEYMTNHMNK
jgi:hypothetical protein